MIFKAVLKRRTFDKKWSIYLTNRIFYSRHKSRTVLINNTISFCKRYLKQSKSIAIGYREQLNEIGEYQYAIEMYKNATPYKTIKFGNNSIIKIRIAK